MSYSKDLEKLQRIDEMVRIFSEDVLKHLGVGDVFQKVMEHLTAEEIQSIESISLPFDKTGTVRITLRVILEGSDVPTERSIDFHRGPGLMKTSEIAVREDGAYIGSVSAPVVGFADYARLVRILHEKRGDLVVDIEASLNDVDDEIPF